MSQTYTGGIGRFEDGRIAEIFINGSKAGTAAETNARMLRSSPRWHSSMAARWKPSATLWFEPVVQMARWRRCWIKSKSGPMSERRPG